MNLLGGLRPGVEIVDLIIAIIAIEMLAFGLLRRWPIVIGLLPGLFLTFAVRAAWVGASWPWAVACLAAALPAHIWDLRSRTRAGASAHPITSGS